MIPFFFKYESSSWLVHLSFLCVFCRLLNFVLQFLSMVFCWNLALAEMKAVFVITYIFGVLCSISFTAKQLCGCTFFSSVSYQRLFPTPVLHAMLSFRFPNPGILLYHELCLNLTAVPCRYLCAGSWSPRFTELRSCQRYNDLTR